MAGLQERLELPGPGPAVPVGDVGLDGADEHAGTALGAEIGVDAEGAGADRDDRAGEGGVDLGPFGGDEEDVDVARVVELPGPVLAHGDDGQAVVGSGKADGAGEDPIADDRERAGHLFEVAQAVEVPCRDLEQGKVLAAHEVLHVLGLCGIPPQKAAFAGRPSRRRVQLREHVEGGGVGDDDPRKRVAGGRNGHEPRREGGLGLQSVAGVRKGGEELVGHQPHRVGSR